MVGETGGNDYNFAFAQGKSIEEAKKLVPDVVEIIKDAVRVSCPVLHIFSFVYLIYCSFYMFTFNRLSFLMSCFFLIQRVIHLGATQVIVPGNFPIGCFPMSLEMFKSNNKSAYDEHQCLKEFNDFAAFHNKYLQQAIITLQEENPATTIVYGDYYNAFKWLLYNAPHLGNSSCE